MSIASPVNDGGGGGGVGGGGGNDGLTFQRVAKYCPEGTTPERIVGARWQQGLQSLDALIQLHQDLAEAQQVFAARIRDATSKSSAALSRMKGMPHPDSTFASMWDETNNFVVSVARLSEQMAHAVQVKIVDPLKASHSAYQSIGQRNLGVTATTNSGDFGGDPGSLERKCRRAENKLKVATEEWQSAKSSRSEMVARFGAELRDDLLQKANERVKRAEALKAQATKDLLQLNKKARSGGPDASSSNPPRNGATTAGPLSADKLHEMEKVEKTRVVITRDSLRYLVRLYFRSLQSFGTPVVALANAVEAFSPNFSIQSWLATAVGQSGNLAVSDTEIALSPSEKEWLRETAPGAIPQKTGTFPTSDQMATIQSLKNLLKQKESQVKALVEEVAILKEEGALKKESHFPEGEPPITRKEEKETEVSGKLEPARGSPTAAGGRFPSVELLRDSEEEGKRKEEEWRGKSRKPRFQPPESREVTETVGSFESAEPDETPAASGLTTRAPPHARKAGQPLDRRVSRLPSTKGLVGIQSPKSPAGTENKRLLGVLSNQSPLQTKGNAGTSLLHRMVTTIKGGPLARPLANAPSTDSEDDDRVETLSEEEYSAEEYGDFRLSDYVPTLSSRLQVDFPPTTKTFDKIVEIQRRYEEYLWSLRNLHLADLVRTDYDWDSDDYFKGFDVEYGIEAYTVKLPYNLALNARIERDSPFAMEWGTPTMKGHEWRLFAYETLLLIYHSMATPLVIREVTRLPAHDIRRVAVHQARDWHDEEGLPQSRDVSEAGEKFGEDGGQAVLAQVVQYNAQLIKQLLRQLRVRLGISAADNQIITGLLLPHGLEFGEETHALGFVPLDARYRVARLHSSWVAAGRGQDGSLQQKMQSNVAKLWVYRQLHFVRISLLMKIARLVKFLPQLRNIYVWFLEWPTTEKWHRFISAKIPPPDLEDDRFLEGHLTQFIDCLKLGTVILADFFAANQANKWGVDIYRDSGASIQLARFTTHIPRDVRHARNRRNGSRSFSSGAPSLKFGTAYSDDESNTPDGNQTDRDLIGYGYRNAEGFMRLIALMGYLTSLDRRIRSKVAEEERLLALGGNFHRAVQSDSDWDADDDENEPSRKDNPQDAGKVLFQDEWHSDSASFDLLAVLNSYSVDCYWQYELPIQHLVISEFCRLVCDPQAPSKLTVDAGSVVHGVLIATHMLQHGYDPTLWARMKVPQAITSLDTMALYFAKAIWDETVRAAEHRDEQRGEFDIDSVSGVSLGGDLPSVDEAGALPANFMISLDTVRIMNEFSANFSSWLLATGGPTGAGGSQFESGTQVGTVTTDMIYLRQTTLGEISFPHLRVQRLLENTPHDLFESLGRPRGEFRDGKSRNLESGLNSGALGGMTDPVGMLSRLAGEDKKFTNATDPDFALLDYDKLDELADKPNIFQQIENIREEPEGVSLMLPSRVERLLVELMLRRLISNEFRIQLFNLLCNYRQHCEAETLPSVIHLFERIHDLQVLTPVKIPPQTPDVSQFNVIAPLPQLLIGPIAQYDLYRFFISQAVRNLFERLFGDARETIHNPTEEDAWFLSRLVDLEEEPEADRVEIEKAWAHVIGQFSAAANKFMTELRAELIFYTPVWTQFLPGNQHALIVMHIADERLRNMFDDLRNTPFWPEEDLPPNSAPLVAALGEFDRLVKEVRVGTRFEHLLMEVEPLSTPLATPLANALSKRLRSVETILDRCMKSETWHPVSPPHVLHSAAMVDYFQFVYHILEAVWEYNGPAEFIIPVVIQFIGRITRQFFDAMKGSVAEPRLLTLSSRCNDVWNHLLAPVPRVDVSLLGQLIGGPQKRKKGIMGLIPGIRGKGKKGHHGKDLTTQLQQVRKLEGEGGGAETVVSNLPGGGEGPDEHIMSDEDESEDGGGPTLMAGHKGGVPVGGIPKKKKWKSKTKEEMAELGIAEITDELKDLAGRIGPILAVQLLNVGGALGKSPLPTWLTRLHNLHYFSEQLPEIAQRLMAVALEQSSSQHPKHFEILKALEKAGGRKAAAHDRTQTQVDEQTQQKLQFLSQQLQAAVDQCKVQLLTKAKDICRITALRIVYLDFCSDLFEELYNPNFAQGLALSDVFQSMNQTVMKFIQAAPLFYQQELLKCTTHEIVKAWAMVLTEMGYMGHIFGPDDLATLDNDLDAIKQFTAVNKIDMDTAIGADIKERQGMLGRFGRREEPTEGEKVQTVNICDYITEFLKFLGTQPILLAQLGGNYDPEKQRQKTIAAAEPTSPISAEPETLPEVPDVFKQLGGVNEPAFDAKELLGAQKKKKKKGVFGGVMKAVGLK